MLTPSLQTHLNQAIERLLPLFKVATEERAHFRPFTIRRHLDPTEFSRSSRDRTPAYHFLATYFYFHEKDPHTANPDLSGVFAPAIIHHEAGHYVHDQVNPSRRKEMLSLMAHNNRTLDYSNTLNELVADYGCLILGLYTAADQAFYFHHHPFGRFLKTIYDQYGADFLPRLARM